MADEMIEIVARALCRHAWERHFNGRNIDAYVESHWRDHASGARVAIKAMRDPTIEMTRAGARGDIDVEDATYIWQDMIDTAAKFDGGTDDR